MEEGRRAPAKRKTQQRLLGSAVHALRSCGCLAVWNAINLGASAPAAHARTGVQAVATVQQSGASASACRTACLQQRSPIRPPSSPIIALAGFGRPKVGLQQLRSLPSLSPQTYHPELSAQVQAEATVVFADLELRSLKLQLGRNVTRTTMRAPRWTHMSSKVGRTGSTAAVPAQLFI
jgi:hypothetical protein